MDERLEIVRLDGSGTKFSVQRVIVAIDTVAKAAESVPIKIPFDEQGEMGFPTIAQFASNLRDLIEGAMKNEGSLTVRFLGDLKASIYPIDTQFYHLSESTSDGGDFSKLIQKALLSTSKQDLTFINLANVRDVKINVGNHRALNVSDDIRFLTTFCEVLESWADASASMRVQKAK